MESPRKTYLQNCSGDVMSGIRTELFIFLTAFVTGAVLRMAYICLTYLRKIVKHRKILVDIEDMIYWIGSSLYLFVQIYHTSDGRIRWFFLLGVAVGVVFISWIFKKIKNIYKKIYTARRKDLTGKP